MKPKQFWINLPVKDVRKSKVFFTEIGFTPNPKYQSNNDSASILIGEHDFAMMLFSEEAFKGFAQHKVSDTTQGSEVLLNIDAQNREEVDEMAQILLQAGGNIFAEPAEAQGWMYAFGFEDLDGHRWSVLHMDTDKMPLDQ